MAGKDMSGFLKSFAGNLGGQMSGMGQIGGPMSGIGLMKQLMGGGGGGGDEDKGYVNPGEKMFGMSGKEDDRGGNGSFLSKFGSSLTDQLFQKAMRGFMGL